MGEAISDGERGNSRNRAASVRENPTISAGLLAAGFAILLFACASAPQPADDSAGTIAQPASEAPYSSADSLLLLLNTPETFDVLQRHIPFFVNLTEHGIIPPFSTELTLNDLLQVP